MFKQRTLENSIYAINCSLPNIYVILTKHRFDLIQTLLDSLSRWQLFSNPSDTTIKPPSTIHLSPKLDQVDVFGNADDNRGPKSEQTNMLDEEQLDFEPPCQSLASFVSIIHNMDVVIICSSTAQPSSSSISPPKFYELQLSELGFFGVVRFEGKSVSYFNLDIEKISLSDVTTPTSRIPIISKVNTDMLKAKHSKSMLLSTFIITTNMETGNRDNLATVSTNDLMWNLQLKSTFMEDMVAFGTALNDNPSDDSTQSTTRLFLIIENSVIDFAPLDHPTKAVIAAESLKLSTNLISKSPDLLIKIFLQNATFFLIDDQESINEEIHTEGSGPSFSSLKGYYRALGYAVISSVDFLEVLVKLNKDDQLPQFDLEITNQTFLLETCPDSFQTLLEFVNYISQSTSNSSGKKGNPAQLEVDEAQNNNNDDSVLTDMLSSLDENAFGPPNPDCAKLASDVGEGNLTFVEEYYAAEVDSKKAPNYYSSEESDMLEDYPSGFDLEDSGDDEWKPVEAIMSPQLPENDFKEFEMPTLDSEDTVRPLDDEQLVIVEDYFTVPSFMEEQDQTNISKSINHIRICDFNFIWKLYTGNDWKKSKNPFDTAAPKAEVHDPENLKGKDKDVLYSTSPDFDYYMYEPELAATTPSGSEYASSTVSSEKGYFDDDHRSFSDETMTLPESHSTAGQINHSPKKGRKRDKNRAKQGRSRSSQLDIKLLSINADYQQYPLGVETASRARFSIRDVEIIDRVQTSMWKKFLSYLRPDSDTSPRETWSNMVRIELDGVRPVPNVPLEEMRLKIRLLPIRLHIDQDTLEFVIRFFNAPSNTTSPVPSERKDNIYFQYCEILPIVLKFDYKPKHLDYGSLKGGNFAELVNLFRLEEADMMLLGVKLRGISGVERLLEELGSAWKPYIISTQVPNVVTGVASVKTLVNLGSGLADLVLLPVEQYMKDGQLIRGIQRGASSFAKATTMEIIKLGTKLAVGAQVLLEQADDILSFDHDEERLRRNSNYEVDPEEDEAAHPKSKYSEQPSDFNEGIELAYKSLSKNIGTATHSLITVPIQIYDRSGAQSSIRALIRGTPSAVLKPMIGATEAISKVLLGARNSIDPNKRLQMEDKYK
ncbi:autophagy- protein 2 [Basidiobolus ranarum]|uniref:Autophagy-related protein 2 n=1 Tax=Basidiobolus ranarum TaxID=34480 RepID=A0ABR2WQ87_9FUNG